MSAAIALPLLFITVAATAQPSAKTPRIGFLVSGSPSTHKLLVDSMRRYLAELGYVEGQTIAFEFRWAEGKADRFPALAADLVRRRVDLIVTAGSPAVRALKEATSSIPIVVAGAGDVVGAGLVASLARPGGNITGCIDISPELSGKRLEILKEAVPAMVRVGIIWGPGAPDTALQLRETEAAARALGVQAQLRELHGPQDFEPAYGALARERANAVIIIQNSFTLFHRRSLLELAGRHRLPVMCEAVEWAQDGCLIAYGPSRADTYRRAASYVDRILKGAKPAEMPIEQPTKFELIFNQKTATGQGFTLPHSLPLRADQVIQ